MRAYQRFLLITSLCATSQAQAKFEAHEWGTFTSLVGSNGITQHGMYHEDEVLPGFVHGFGETRNELRLSQSVSFNLTSPPPTLPPPPPPPRKCRGKGCFYEDVFVQNVITQKMETPVIYFYSDIKRKVQVDVRFPEGVITETFPAPVRTSPQRQDDLVIANGRTVFEVDVLPALSGKLPEVEADNIYAHARNVQSNVVRSGSEEEKFIFYRGLGRFQPAFEIKSINGSLSLKASAAALPQAAFLVHVDQAGEGQMLELETLRADTVNTVESQKIQALSNHGSGIPDSKVLKGQRIRIALLKALEKAGLFGDEAKAMLDTWEHGYLKVPGLRLLYILPRAEVDQVLPLTFTPAPDKLERVFVGRIEVLLDTEERQILSDIQAQGADFQVQSLGRFAEPVLRRILEVAPASQKGLISTFIEKAATEDIGSSAR